jgi:hypothetical protein
MKKLVLIALFVCVLGSINLANAALYDRGVDSLGNHLFYDSGLNITWYDAPFWGHWYEAMSWANGLNIGGVTGWRLPKTLPVNGSYYNLNWSSDGSTDVAYNIGAPGSAYPGSKASEMAYLYFVTLGNKGSIDLLGFPQPGGGLVNVGPFSNLIGEVGHIYAISSEYSGYPFYFFLRDGAQGVHLKTANYNALAVHDGDIAAQVVPLPGAVWLLGSGLVALVGFRKRFTK